ncbi:hypothetical protein IFM89_037015 [Coptis chinensis]|uniref:AB hydrolase-1 domain-containing protein n=1 Tax=Coptis chinensis TaxID=261450 RepID=A0A835LU86_9MAGN|nr:hypothetical protein IFM89_037015 [Coptis chinensis]
MLSPRVRGQAFFDDSVNSERRVQTLSREKREYIRFTSVKRKKDFVHGEGFGARTYLKKKRCECASDGVILLSVILLAGHSCGGASISYAFECCPKKISKAVFVCATMVSDGQKPFDVFAEEIGSAEMFVQESQLLVYGNGQDKPPTSLRFDKQQTKGLYFNQTPSKDVALATVSMRPIPLEPIMEKLSLTPANYGTSRRFFVQTLDDHALSPDVQEKLVRDNPPAGVFKIKGSDHCPFFSKPQSLHKTLLEIAQIP